MVDTPLKKEISFAAKEDCQEPPPTTLSNGSDGGATTEKHKAKHKANKQIASGLQAQTSVTGTIARRTSGQVDSGLQPQTIVNGPSIGNTMVDTSLKKKISFAAEEGSEESPPTTLSDGLDRSATTEKHKANISLIKQIDSGLIIPDDSPPISSSGAQVIEKFDTDKVTPPASSAATYNDEAPPFIPPWEARPGAEHIRGPYATHFSSLGTIIVGDDNQTPVATTGGEDEPELLNAELVQDKIVHAIPITDDGHTHEYQDLRRDYRKLRVVVGVILVIVLIAGLVAGVVVGTKEGLVETGEPDTHCAVGMDLTCTDSLARDCAAVGPC